MSDSDNQFDTSGYIDLDSYLKKHVNFIICNNGDAVTDLDDLNNRFDSLINNNIDDSEEYNGGIGSTIREDFYLKSNELREYKFPEMFDLITDIECEVPFMKVVRRSSYCYYNKKPFHKMFYDDDNSIFNMINIEEAKYVKLTYNGIKLSYKDYDKFLESGISYLLKNDEGTTHRIYLK